MEPINNANAVNYPVTMPQQQEYSNDYSTIPTAYDDVYAEKSKAASNMSGLAILGTLGLAGLALWGGHAWGKKGAKNAIETAENAAKEALAKADAVKAEKEALQKANDEAYKIAEEKYTTGFWNKGKLRTEIKKALRPNEADAKKTAQTAEKSATQATATNADAAQEAADAAKEAAESAS